MNSPDQPETTTESFEGVHDVPLPKSHIDSRTRAISSASQIQESNFDWIALGIVVLIAAFFAITARFHAQPATSFVPVAVLSATGCGLLVTAIRKLHTSKGVGLLEAALGGFFMALLQFTVALTYPGVFDSCRHAEQIRHPGYLARREFRSGALRVNLSADADERWVRRAFELRLNCLNTIRGCRNPGDIAPAAWQDQIDDGKLAVSDIANQARVRSLCAE